jgi:putative phosphonate metabolism protein
VTETPRFAIYFVPAAETQLYRFGAAALGYDCYTQADVAHPADSGIDDAEWVKLTQESRGYGFHATLKAPFHLSPEFDEAALTADFKQFAASVMVVPAVEPAVELLGKFVAIVPRIPVPDLDRLAADCVTAFDRFRAPMRPEDRRRRLAEGLTERQAAHLDRWGYPYVFEDFRFHMTLTGKLRLDRSDFVLGRLREQFMHGLVIDRLSLARQDHLGARFRVIFQMRIGKRA